MAVYTHLNSETIAAWLRENYGARALTRVQGIAEGVSNSNYLVEFTDASGAHIRAILTLFESRTNPQDVPYFMALMQHLAQRGIACPAPLMRKDGDLCGELAGKMAAMVSFLEGKSRTALANSTQANAVGEALGKLHLSGADFTMQRANGLSLSAWQQLYEKTASQLDNIQSGCAEEIQKEIAFLTHAWPATWQLPPGVIHADFFPDNIFFTGDAITGMIDFYFACNDALAYDLAIALNAWCFTADWQFNAAMAQAMIAGYETIRPLRAEEKSALPLLLRGAAVRFLLTRAHDWIFHDATALVTRKDPSEYMAKLRFHQQHDIRPLLSL